MPRPPVGTATGADSFGAGAVQAGDREVGGQRRDHRQLGGGQQEPGAQHPGSCGLGGAVDLDGSEPVAGGVHGERGRQPVREHRQPPPEHRVGVLGPLATVGVGAACRPPAVPITAGVGDGVADGDFPLRGERLVQTGAGVGVTDRIRRDRPLGPGCRAGPDAAGAEQVAGEPGEQVDRDPDQRERQSVDDGGGGGRTPTGVGGGGAGVQAPDPAGGGGPGQHLHAGLLRGVQAGSRGDQSAGGVARVVGADRVPGRAGRQQRATG